jgi:Ca-activated chloride channel family protein
MVDRERSTVILFLTDGLATEGETDTGRILTNVEDAAPPNVRLFTFGVGDDVDTLLLDQLNQKFRGAGAYVRPTERIDDEVSGLYNKISAPVLANVELDFGDILVEDMYPSAPLPDLFAGTQLIVVGRYRDGGSTTIRLTGDLNDERQTYRYEVRFPDHAGGEVFIPRLWATRKIGALLNAIRLHGEDPELVDSIVRLSIRYGIITPYTSFLITENDIFTQSGVEEAQTVFHAQTDQAFGMVSGEAAVNAAESAAGLSAAEAPLAPMSTLPPSTPGFREGTEGEDGSSLGGGPAQAAPAGQQPIQYVSDRTFVWRDGAWVDTLYNADDMTPTQVLFLSDPYFELLSLDPVIGEFMALGDHVLFVWGDQAYEVVPQ